MGLPKLTFDVCRRVIEEARDSPGFTEQVLKDIKEKDELYLQVFDGLAPRNNEDVRQAIYFTLAVACKLFYEQEKVDHEVALLENFFKTPARIQ